MRPWQAVLNSVDRNPLFPSEALMREAVRTLVTVAGPWTALFCIVDDHIHVVLVCSEAEARQLANALHRTLQPRAAVPMAPPFVEALRGRSHMQSQVGYVLDQTSHHGIPVHPALWSGNCFADLIGARLLEGFGHRIGQALPRFRLRQAYQAVGLEARPLVEPGADELQLLGLHRIVRASWDTFAIGPLPASGQAEGGLDRSTVLARRAATAVADLAGFDSGQLAASLGVSARTVRRLRSSAIEPRQVRGVLLRIGLEQRVEMAYRRVWREHWALRRQAKQVG